MMRLYGKNLAAILALSTFLCFLFYPGKGSTNTGITPAPVITDQWGLQYLLQEIIPADLNGDGQEELVVLYKSGGTSSFLYYQVWRYQGGAWLLWHEREGLYQGTIEVLANKILERQPVHKQDDANALPGAFIQREYQFHGEFPFLVEEKVQLLQSPHTMGDWKNPPRAEILEMIREAALLKGVPPIIIQAVAYTESNLRQFKDGEPLQSFDGYSWGIMQVSPHSYPKYDLEKLKYDIRYNIMAGTEILLDKWGYAFGSSPIIPKIGDNDPRILEHYYFALWAYNGWSQSNNPNMMPYEHPGWTQTEAYQDKVIRYAWEQFEQRITPIPPEELPEEGRPSSATLFATPKPSHAGEYRTPLPGDTLISAAGLVLRNDSWTRLSPNLPQGKGLEVLAGPLLHNGYLRYKITTIEENDSPRTGWVAMNWAYPMADADINGDGWVDLFDLALMANNLGQPLDNDKLDLNYDGAVDAYDLLLAQRYYRPDLLPPLPGSGPLTYISSHSQAQAGEVFTLDIQAGYLDDLIAYEFHIPYNPEKLQLLLVEDLDPFSSEGGSSRTILNREDLGLLQFAKVSLTDEGQSGAGGFLRLHFQAVAELETQSLLADGTARYSNGAGLPIYPAVLGDVSGSGGVDVGDAVLILRFIVGLTELNDRQLWTANVTGSLTGDGKPLVDVGDAVLVLRYIVGLIEGFPAASL